MHCNYMQAEQVPSGPAECLCLCNTFVARLRVSYSRTFR